jgi:enoyl-CoA hydratase
VSDLRYEVDGRVARITLTRPESGNAITATMPRALAEAVEAADLDPAVRCVLLSGEGPGFCGGYDLAAWAEHFVDGAEPSGVPTDVATQAANHDPESTWDPMLDFQAMRRNVRAFMALAEADKPVVCKVQGFCVAGGTDMALCSDLLVIAEDAKIGYPPARVWGSPTTAVWAQRIGVQRAARLLFTGDCLTGAQAAEWGLAIEACPAAELDARAEALVERIARMPVNQLVMMKLLLRQGLHGAGLGPTQAIGTLLDGAARHTPEGHAFRAQAAQDGWRAAVQSRDEPFGDLGLKPSF